MAKKKRRSDTRYDPRIGRAVCDFIAGGGTLREWCRKNPKPTRRTIQRWLEAHPAFADQWKIARLLQCDEWADEMIEVANDSSKDTTLNDKGKPVCDGEWINRSRLRVDTMKWLISKRHPDYGDKVELSGKGGGPMQFRWLDEEPAKPNGHATPEAA